MNEKICPTCGTEYPANERFCPRDGTALRSMGGGTDLVGSIIAERYHVMKKLGEGGMGQVYLAEHVKMGRKSAVKVMNPGMVNDADAISRFNREAANASRINHPNVAGIYDFGETPDGLIYLAMEFIEGESLTSIIEKQGALKPDRAADIIKQTADGLQVAHDMGIVHRDLKPDNIMIAKRRDGGDLVKVVDFGIAKAAGSENQKVTKTGLVVGTPEYMSPEQLSGDKLDGRSDIYSLALVAFNCLTGKLPFMADSAQESMIMRLTDEPATLQSVKPDVNWTPEVQRVMRKALERKKDDRYDSAAKFGQELWDAVNKMPKGAPAGATQMIGAADGATAVMTAPPPTRVDASAASIPAPAPAAPVAPPVSAPVTAPAKSRMPMFAGVGVVALGLAAAAMIYLPKAAGKTGAVPDSTKNATSVTAPQQGGAQTSTATLPTTTPTSNPAGNSSSSNRPSGVPNSRPSGTSTAPGGVAVSYGAELETLANGINDPKSGETALQKVQEYDSKVTLPEDKTTLKFVEAKATLWAVSGGSGCRMFKTINRSLLRPGLRSDLDEALQTCAQ